MSDTQGTFFVGEFRWVCTHRSVCAQIGLTCRRVPTLTLRVP